MPKFYRTLLVFDDRLDLYLTALAWIVQARRPSGPLRIGTVLSPAGNENVPD